MRRILATSLVLLMVGRSPAAAQACRGLAPFSSGPVQLTGEGSLTTESNAVGAGLGLGLPTGPFGALGVASRSSDTFGGSSVELSGAAGYQFELGPGNRFQVCPVASLGVGMGPNNAFGSGVERSSRAAQLGVAVATTIQTRREWQMIPSVSLSYAYRKDQAHDQSGATLFKIADQYALAQLGLGFVVNSKFSIRPHLDLPIAPDQGAPAIGLTLGYNFGKQPSTQRRVP